MNTRAMGLTGAAALFVLAAACNNNPAPLAPAGGAGGGAGTTLQVMALSDAQSAAVLSALNSGEILVAQAVLPRLANADAEAFAQRMITEHGTLNQQAAALLMQLGITPQANAVSQALDANAQQVISQLSGMSGAALDLAYMNSQVQMHEQALGMLDCVVLNSVQNGTLRQFVMNTVRPGVIDHLASATSLVAALGGAQARVGTADGGTGADAGTADGGAVAGVTPECSLACLPPASGGLFPEPVAMAACTQP